MYTFASIHLCNTYKIIMLKCPCLQAYCIYMYHVLYVIYFQAYEKGIALFKWPMVYDIWNKYLTKFIERYVSMHCIFKKLWLLTQIQWIVID